MSTEEAGAPETTETPAAPETTAPASGQEAEPLRPKRSRRARILRQITELPALIVVAFLIAVVIKTFLVQAFYIPSGSMIPTLHIGDRVLVEKISYRLHSPRRDDVVVFSKSVFGGQQPDVPWYDDAKNYVRDLLGLPTGSTEDFIKRVVAVGGDTIRYVGRPRALYVNGAKQSEPFINHGRDPSSPSLTSSDCKRLRMQVAGKGCLVPAGQVFVMGDNRGNSEDSRILGPVKDSKVVGRAFTIIWPTGDFGGL
jgi:signal peptidase I